MMRNTEVMPIPTDNNHNDIAIAAAKDGNRNILLHMLDYGKDVYKYTDIVLAAAIRILMKEYRL